MVSDAGRPGNDAYERARSATARALSAEFRAQRYDQLVAEGSPGFRTMCQELAVAQRRTADRHRASARIHEAVAHRLEESRSRIATATVARLVNAVADALGVESAAVVLRSSCEADATAVSSDARAQLVQEAELILAEGPSHDVTRSGSAVGVRATEIDTRWPLLAEAVASVGVHHVAAVPLRAGESTVGALTVLDPPWTSATSGLTQLATVGEALIETVIDDLRAASWKLDRAPIVDGDRMPLLHMAAGMVAAQRRCTPTDALALIQAHAYAAGVGPGQVALEITQGRLELAD